MHTMDVCQTVCVVGDGDRLVIGGQVCRVKRIPSSLQARNDLLSCLYFRDFGLKKKERLNLELLRDPSIAVPFAVTDKLLLDSGE